MNLPKEAVKRNKVFWTSIADEKKRWEYSKNDQKYSKYNSKFNGNSKKLRS